MLSKNLELQSKKESLASWAMLAIGIALTLIPFHHHERPAIVALAGCVVFIVLSRISRSQAANKA
jgi:hypothetical protein